jgi:hypothetical protein
MMTFRPANGLLFISFFRKQKKEPLNGRGRPADTSLESLFQKVKTTLPAESKKYLGQIENSLKAGPKPYKKYGKFKEIINQVDEAVLKPRMNSTLTSLCGPASGCLSVSPPR